jgi:1-acyl-sn-glycerol-3-phosphate acyltransferase
MPRSYAGLFTLGAAFVPFILPEHLVVVPLCLVGFFWEPAWGLATRLNRRMFRIVLGVQPWYSARISVSLPPSVASHQEGCLVVANHRSHLDAFLLFREITHLRLVAKHLLYYVPFYGHLMPLLKMIRVRQSDSASYLRAMEKVRVGLTRGHRVAVFPEMTRCEPGELGTRPFPRAPFHAAREAGVPVLPIAFWGTDEIWAKGSQKIGAGIARMRSLPPVNPRDFPDSLALAEHVRDLIDRAVLELRAEAAT